MIGRAPVALAAVLAAQALIGASHARSISAAQPQPDLEALPFLPRHYLCYRAGAAPQIDGKLTDAAWAAAPWSEAFVDIEGDRRPRPGFLTRAKMLWDDDYFYVAADLEEPDVWGTLTTRDAVIYHDNDFELFIDPDGDTHAYYELEVNALGTPWDLLLLKPYRDHGPAIHGWDIAGLRLGIDVRGTLNRPGDRDDGWSVEIAMPWTALSEAAPGRKPPQAGERWRLNFSRVEWTVDASGDRYVKKTKPGTTEALPEHNWVWSPQGAVAMHMPERWGYVQFSRASAPGATERFVEDPNEQVKWALRRLYYRQTSYRARNGRYAPALAPLDAAGIHVAGLDFTPSLRAGDDRYEIAAPAFGGAVAHITEDGRVWLTPAGRR